MRTGDEVPACGLVSYLLYRNTISQSIFWGMVGMGGDYCVQLHVHLLYITIYCHFLCSLILMLMLYMYLHAHIGHFTHTQFILSVRQMTL